MKYAPLWIFLLLAAAGCNQQTLGTKLLSEQKLLKDSANNTNQKMGDYLRKGMTDSADIQKKTLGALYTRLIAIQFSIDSLAKTN